MSALLKKLRRWFVVTKIQTDSALLEEIYDFQKQFMKNHKCKEGIDFPDGSHTCRKIEQATARHFKERYNQNILAKLEILNSV